MVESMNLSLSDIEEQSEGVGDGLEEHSEGTTSGAAFQSQSDASPKTYVLSEKGLDDLAEKLASMLVEKKTNRDTEDEKKFTQLLNELKETDDEYICLSRFQNLCVFKLGGHMDFSRSWMLLGSSTKRGGPISNSILKIRYTLGAIHLKNSTMIQTKLMPSTTKQHA